MKILNLYAGIGGNRKLWGDKHEITAIENVPEIAKIYQDFYPNDKVIITNAHEYLRQHYKEFDFIWSSPPCPTHSRLALTRKNKEGWQIKYPNMKLYEEILLLKHYFKGKWLVENVISFYNPLIKPQRLGRHYYWSNYYLGYLMEKINEDIANDGIKELEEYHGFSLEKYKLDPYLRRLMLRNCVKPNHALHIFNMAFKDKQETLIKNAI